MKTTYKYIQFVWKPGYGHGAVWLCLNKRARSVLGYATFYKPWKQWVMEFNLDCVFNKSCLDDMSHFLSQLHKTEPSQPKPKEQPGD